MVGVSSLPLPADPESRGELSTVPIELRSVFELSVGNVTLQRRKLNSRAPGTQNLACQMQGNEY